MRKFLAAGCRLGLAIFIFCAFFISSAVAQTPAASSARKPIIVELFTSEGCNTCPPADALLQRLEIEQPVDGAEIVGLEEHVDYFNHEGWKDPYSSAEWTRRQQGYKDIFKKDPYTPQMVVDGQAQFIGSDTRAALTAVTNAAQNVQTGVTITSDKAADASASPKFTVSIDKLEGNTSGDAAEVWLAITEDGLQSSVKKGENAGQTLRHTATLRSLRKIGVANAGAGASFTGNPEVKIEPQWNAKNVHVVVFVQEKKSGKILGAASVKFPQ
jgi:hypothetical protein